MEELLRIGPFLWERKEPLLREKWGHEREKWRKVRTQLERSDKPQAQERIKQIESEIDWIDGVLTCLHMDKQ